MTLSDPAGIAYLVAAISCAAVAVVAWRRRAHNQTLAMALSVAMGGACWWAVCFALPRVAPTETVKAVTTWAAFPGPSLMAAAFMCLGLAIARPQWVPSHGLIAALLVEPIGITLASATNPWLLLVYRGVGVVHLTGPGAWTYGPAFWADTWFDYLEMIIGLGAIGWAWRKAPPAFRGQRLAVFVGALVPFAANVVFLIGGLSDILDPTPLGLAVTGPIVGYAVFRQELITFSPVARALLVDQIGDAVVVISPGGRVLDLNPAAAGLVRGMNPDVPSKLIGLSAASLLGDDLARGDSSQTEVIVELPGARAEFQVRSSPLIDRHHKALGTVLVARDVTEANALTRRLAAAHTQLVAQVETIDLLRADLVEQASRDPLTGLHNRRHLVERFAAMLTAARVNQDSLAVALFDVDRFKAINDDHGHLAGDAVLVSLARQIQEHAPRGALVARWGGEEFFVAMPGADSVAGFAVADALRDRWAQEPTLVAGRLIRCTISGGVASYPASGTTMDDLFHAADHAMYQAKNDGRNIVHLDVGKVPSRRTPANRA